MISIRDLGSDLHDLVARSMSLFERIDLFRAEPTCFSHSKRAAEHLLRWEQVLHRASEPGAFDRRLRFEGFDRVSILPVLGDVVLPGSSPAPNWVAIVASVLERMRAGDGEPTPSLALLEASIPFVDYWLPWLAVARDRVSAWPTFCSRVQQELTRSLLGDLSRAGTQCLMHEFDVARLDRGGGGGNELFFARIASERSDAANKQTPTDPPNDKHYREFIASLHGPRALAFLRRYPCFARLAATQIEQWSRHVSELASRLERDRPELEARLGLGLGGEPLGTLAGVDPDLSDPHNGGRRVVGLHFSSGVRVIYKPKSLATEGAFQALLTRMNEQLRFEPPLRALVVVERERASYGWVEFISPRACRSESELRDYHVRCGALLALVTLLRGTDCHFENVIASGGDPVLIDHEALLAPSSTSTAISTNDIETNALEAIRPWSVLRTSLLPGWQVGLDGSFVDLSGFGARGERAFRGDGDARERWRAVGIKNANTDLMTFETADDDDDAQQPQQQPMTSMLTNVPSIEGAPPRPINDFESEVIHGFRRVYRLLAAHPRERDDGLALFSGLPSRFVPRTTIGYAHLLRESQKPHLMSDGLLRTITLDRMAWMLLADTSTGGDNNSNSTSSLPPAAWPILRIEHDSLVRGDVPFFLLRTDQTSLFARDATSGEMFSVAENVFAQSGFDAVKQAARAMSEEELAIEVKLIEQSFAAATTTPPPPTLLLPEIDR